MNGKKREENLIDVKKVRNLNTAANIRNFKTSSHWSQPEMVSLMWEDQRFWDKNKLMNIFPSEEVKAIFSIPIGSPSVKDSIVWVASKDGGYSVRSGYWFLNEKREHGPRPSVNDALSENKPVWISIWG
ncbi:hypothetical protein V6N11_075010 [Hibiscus sabdariffa]|uniref:Uncharacterized protein n=1 Tax=Hibiscus sabdariffa TaxID=183260 RepID=A0ABR2R5P6_9ROSI